MINVRPESSGHTQRCIYSFAFTVRKKSLRHRLPSDRYLWAISSVIFSLSKKKKIKNNREGIFYRFRGSAPITSTDYSEIFMENLIQF